MLNGGSPNRWIIACNTNCRFQIVKPSAWSQASGDSQLVPADLTPAAAKHLANLFRPEFSQTVIAVEIEMHVFVKCLIPGNARRAGRRPVLARHHTTPAVRRRPLRHLPDGGVDPRIGAERQRVVIARHLKLLAAARVRQCQLALGQAEMRLGKLRVQFGRLREFFGGGGGNCFAIATISLRQNPGRIARGPLEAGCCWPSRQTADCL